MNNLIYCTELKAPKMFMPDSSEVLYQCGAGIPGRGFEFAKKAAQLFHEQALTLVLLFTLLGMLLLCDCHQLPAKSRHTDLRRHARV